MWPFYLMALVAIVSTVRVVTNANPVHALLSLIVSLLAVAGMFLIVGAPFAGALEVIVYAGAIMVLLLAALVAAFHLGKREPDAEEEKE
nr:NADH-quinone oxidoreductase subunit J [Klebsiella pneumoniae]